MDNVMYKVTVLKTGEVIADKVKIAQDVESRARGLLGRLSLGKGEGLVIKPCGSIHTFFMKFPIDVIFLNKKNQVIKIGRAIPPWRIYGCLFGGFLVIELQSNALNGIEIKQGDFIGIDKM